MGSSSWANKASYPTLILGLHSWLPTDHDCPKPCEQSSFLAAHSTIPVDTFDAFLSSTISRRIGHKSAHNRVEKECSSFPFAVTFLDMNSIQQRAGHTERIAFWGQSHFNDLSNSPKKLGFLPWSSVVCYEQIPLPQLLMRLTSLLPSILDLGGWNIPSLRGI